MTEMEVGGGRKKGSHVNTQERGAVFGRGGCRDGADGLGWWTVS